VALELQLADDERRFRRRLHLQRLLEHRGDEQGKQPWQHDRLRLDGHNLGLLRNGHRGLLRDRNGGLLRNRKREHDGIYVLIRIGGEQREPR
jgi:hypothetical protein